MTTEKFKNKYRIASTRLQHWDYREKAAYFVTICTHDKINYLGEILGDKIILSSIGMVAEQEWLETPAVRSDMNITLEEYVVMPNHFHGIININKFNTDIRPHRDAMHGVSSTTANDTQPVNAFGPQLKNLASIIRGYKSAVTCYARKNNIPFFWQERFHDHIIRNDEELSRIRNYIKQNIINWKADKFY